MKPTGDLRKTIIVFAVLEGIVLATVVAYIVFWK
jgi:hypothetical protein